MAQSSTSTDTPNIVTLAGLGFQTIESFKKVEITLKNQADDRGWPIAQFLSEAERFELWAANLGLFVAGHGSLDYRVRDAEKLAQTLGRFLQELINSLDDVVHICSTSTQEQLLGDSDDEETNQAGSDDEDDEDDESEIDLLLDGIRDPINRLFKVSTKIRNPSTRIGSSKAALFQKIDEETGVDFLQVIRKEDYDYVRSVFLEYQKNRACQEHDPRAPPGETTIGDDQDEVWEPIRTVLLNERTGTDSFLIGRIAQANTLRRRQFAYWARHRDKLHHHTKTSLSAKAPEVGLRDAPAADLPKMGELPSLLAITKEVAVPSVTTATNLNIARLEAMDDRSTWTVSEYAPSTWKPSREVIDFPPAPRPSRKTPFNEFFECPYCFTLCPRETLADKAWKAHLIHDLRPYICTYEHCNNPAQLYDSRRDWVQHENSAHRKVYRCLHHSGQVFTQLEEYKRHLKEEHAGLSNNEASLGRIIQASESVLDVPDRPCPICMVTFDTAKEMEGHIALHLERLAQFSFPRSIADADDGSNADSDKANGPVADESRDGDFESVIFNEFDEGGDKHGSIDLPRTGSPSPNGLTEGAMQDLNNAIDTEDKTPARDTGPVSKDTVVNVEVAAAQVFEYTTKISDIALSPDNKYLALTLDEESVRIRNLSSGEKLPPLIGHESDCWAVAWSSDGCIATGDFDGTIKLWNGESRDCFKTISAHKDTINDLTFSPDGRFLVSASWDKTSQLWRSSGEQVTCENEEQEFFPIYVAGYSPDGKHIVTASDSRISISDNTRSEIRQEIQSHLGLISALTFTVNEKLLITGSWTGHISLWDLESGALIQNIDRAKNEVTALAMSHSGLLMASATADGEIKLWHTQVWAVRYIVRGHTGAVNTILFSNDDTQIISCSDDKTVRVWRLDVASKMELPTHSNRTERWARDYSNQVD
ncbi:hypothetical protein N8I77_005734 [Diaporthe amygdali]|uniref:Mitochondrial division protein 1 n=1 Tax=Phomopsis amygdali TaxID=1214568 RepID=A0AAD9SFN0_PHOAM|nr:hypothetical protein N8I77_005734 [Diaporthe amygdali]